MLFTHFDILINKKPTEVGSLLISKLVLLETNCARVDGNFSQVVSCIAQ